MTSGIETVPASSTRRARRITMAAIGTLLLSTAAVLWSASPAAAATPSVTVSPSSGLTDGQSVTVTGSGFTVVPLIVVVQCAATATGSAGCDTNDVQFVSSDPGGSFTAKLTVRSSFTGADCTKVTCIVQAHEGTNPSTGLTGTSAPLHFGAAAPATTTPAGTTTTPAATTPTTPGQTSSSAVTTGAGTAPGATDPGTTSPTQATKLPTGADTGRAVLTGPPLLAEIGLLLALVLLGAGLIGYRHSRSR